MIIQCGGCGARFRFDETMIQGEGAWVRCSRCRKIFFQENPSPSAQKRVEEKQYPDFQLSPRAEAPPTKTVKAVRNVKTIKRRKRRTALMIVVGIVLLLVVSAGLTVWLVPQAVKNALDIIPGGTILNRYLGIEAPHIMGGGIDFIDVKESFVNNWLIGDLMVINGTAVNRNSYPVSTIRVKANLLDIDGRFIEDAEADCGNFLSNEDLAKLTEKELAERLSFPAGNGIRNEPVAPEGMIPFTIVFIHPPKKAVEYIVETVSVERPPSVSN